VPLDLVATIARLCVRRRAEREQDEDEIQSG
jgi:hypothetical protein